jgi:chromosome partitioning protein
MTKTVSFHLQKGGVGKTTISGTLACQSALEGHPTLLVDVDPQGNASSWFLKETPEYELADVIQGKCFWKDSVISIPQVSNLSILPTFGIGGGLKGYSETRLAEEPYVLQDLVRELSSTYERIVLDLSPGFGRLERAALVASDEVVTPMTPEVFSLDGLEIFIEELERVRKNLRAEVTHSKIIINSFDNRIKQHRDIYAAATKGLFSVFKIPVDPLFRKAQEAGMAPQMYKRHGKGLKPLTMEAFSALDSAIWR